MSKFFEWCVIIIILLLGISSFIFIEIPCWKDCKCSAEKKLIQITETKNSHPHYFYECQECGKITEKIK